MKKNAIQSEDKPIYAADSTALTADDEIVEQARAILLRRLERESDALTTPKSTVDYLEMKLSGMEHEVFACLMLDNRNRVIKYREMFRGTIDGASVYPREVVKQALADNAAAVILAHNHPSGMAEPSQADIAITDRIKKALALVDIRVLDHIIIGGINEHVIFSERGLI